MSVYEHKCPQMLKLLSNTQKSPLGLAKNSFLGKQT